MGRNLVIVEGFKNSVIYDFLKAKAYQVTKFVGKSLTEGTFDKLPREYVRKLEELGVSTSKYWERERAETIADLSPGIPDKPDFCIVELSSCCNFHCPHCYLGPRQDLKELDFDIIHSLLSQIHEMGIKKIHITGGEICLRKDLIAVIRLAYEQGLEIEMATSGSLISEDIVDTIERQVNRVQITLYALSEEVYSRFSSDPIILSKVIAAIEKLKERCPEKLLVTFTLTPYNYQELSAFRQWTEERELETTIGMTMPIGLGLEDEKLISEPYSSFVGSFIKEAIGDISIGGVLHSEQEHVGLIRLLS